MCFTSIRSSISTTLATKEAGSHRRHHEPALALKATLLQEAGLFDGPTYRRLAIFQCLIDRHLTGQRSRDILSHDSAERLKLRDADKLDAGVWHRLYAGVGRVGRLHRLQGGLRKGRRFLVVRAVVGRLAGARRHGGPALILCYQPDVFFRSGPLRKVLGGFGLLGLLGNRKGSGRIRFGTGKPQ
jgi:hypothetical protein